MYIETGFVKNALVIGAETLSKILDWNDRGTCVLFGDGAGAAYLEESDKGIISVVQGSIGKKGMVLNCESRRTHNIFTEAGIEHDYLHMDGQEVFKFAVKSVPTAIETLLHNNNMDVNDVDKFILHQANVRIIESVAKRLKADKDKFPVNLNEYGNTSSASIPILLDELNRNGSLKQGEKLVLAGFGAGLSWGSILLVW